MKRCICGKSDLFPLCNGSHASQGWTCSPPSNDRAALVVVASRSLQSVADRLAHEFAGTVVEANAPELTADRLVVLSDGQDIPELQARIGHLKARRKTLLPIGLSPRAAAWAFADFEIHDLSEVPHSSLWSALVSAYRSQAITEPPRSAPKVFLSHAVVDEPRIRDAVESLRRDFGVQIFTCADSIRSGSDWQATIRQYLAETEVFLSVASEAANRSVFCAFESGFAQAREIPVHIVDLDGGGPPSHLSHLQAKSVPRHLASHPWLTTTEATLDCFLWTIAPS